MIPCQFVNKSAAKANIQPILRYNFTVLQQGTMLNCKAKEKDKITHKTKPCNCPSNQVMDVSHKKVNNVWS